MSGKDPRGQSWPAPLAARVAADASAEQIAEAVTAIWLEIDLALHPIIGHRGVAALYDRSLSLTTATYPWLAIGEPGSQPTVDPSALKAVLAQQSAAEAAASGSALFRSFRELLASLIGTALTDRLLRSVWADPGEHSAGDPPAQDSSS
jgi:hypothetical protein